MHPQRRLLLLINLVGGLAVLGSYAHGLATHPTTRDALWGGVPLWLKPHYTRSMLLATVGYFLFSYHFYFRLPPAETRIAGHLGYGAILGCYALLLGSAALWMPLTFLHLTSPSPALWLLIRLVLGLTALGSLGLLACLLGAAPPVRGGSFWLALLGLAAFSLQTVVLDALVWPAYFDVPRA